MNNDISEAIGGLEQLSILTMTTQPLVAKAALELARALRKHQKQTQEREDGFLALIDSYDWQRQRLHQAAEKVIAWNRQAAKDQYGDADKAESYACVRELRDAIKFCEQKETSND
ncbi:hypothetical protein AAA67_002867 [Salmonella enterica subsp. diarizonae]|nr:hypothetical protein [Salmonella enterica subsp. diarizonae]